MQLLGVQGQEGDLQEARLAPVLLSVPLCSDLTVWHRRYASLYFLACVDEDDNELIVLETVHHFVEARSPHFGRRAAHIALRHAERQRH